MKTRLYYVSATTRDDHDCSVFVEEISPIAAQATWMGWCDWCGLDYDLEDFRIFEVPAPTGHSRTFQWGVDMEDVTP